MKASELRLGNLVQYGGTTAKVCQIEKAFFYCETDGNDFFTRDGESGAKPIPLTKEWLLKFGFVEKNIGNKLSESWYELKYLSNEHEPMITSWVSILINIETWSCVICDEYPDEIGANTKIKIEYVHQLQNLYFALTGEELTLEP